MRLCRMKTQLYGSGVVSKYIDCHTFVAALPQLPFVHESIPHKNTSLPRNKNRQKKDALRYNSIEK
jgi:predicted glycoside hydrolase/deacetylase ChbG (UPF0249 family)